MAESLQPLRAAAGLTALAGEVRTQDGQPLAGVTLRIDDRTARTDDTGRFLLLSVPPGRSELLIDGRIASGPERTYGVFEVGVDLKPGRTNLLPFTIWMPELDTANAVSIPSPTSREVVVTSPNLPGFELHLPAGTTIRDRDGEVVTQISLTRVPVERPPFPLPFITEFSMYFTAQPGGAYIGPYGARIIYPNLTNERPGARLNLWNYDPGEKGWYIYGRGTVTSDGKQVVPDEGVAIYTLRGASVDGTTNGPSEGGGTGARGSGSGGRRDSEGGDPVDLGTGLFLLRRTDLTLPDVLPISLVRRYRPAKLKQGVAPFGIGTSHSYEMFLIQDPQFQETDLFLPEGGRVHYARISSGTGIADALFEHTETPSAFFRSRIRSVNQGWELTLRNGDIYRFSRQQPPLLESVEDHHGNRIVIERASGEHGKVVRVISPSGRWLELTLNQDKRVSSVRDNIGRTVSYSYDERGDLKKVIDPAGGLTEYTYDPRHLLETIKNARGIVCLTNEYPPSPSQALPVLKQTLADGTTYTFEYSTDADGVTQTEVKDPRGHIRRVTFNSDGYIVTDTRAVGTPEEQTITYERQLGTNLVTAVIDPLNRRTTFEHDAFGNVQRITRLAGTPQARVTKLTYDPELNEIATMSDPLGHIHSFGYDESGDLRTVTDPLGNVTTLTYNTAGQPISIADPLGNKTGLTYELGLLNAIIDPMGATTRFSVDSAGRPVFLTDALGNVTTCAYDDHNRLTTVTDSLGGVTRFDYDPNGNLLGVTDARDNRTGYTYNEMDRCTSLTDPLGASEFYEYDELGNLAKVTDRKEQVTAFTYDPLNRLRRVDFADGSSTSFTYDAGDRLRVAADSISGTVAIDYDDFDLPTKISSPEGVILYTYDASERRKSMAVEGQTLVTYAYDDADHLTEIAQGETVVAIVYDRAGRPEKVTLPAEVIVECGYDAASRLTSLRYVRAGSLLGDLSYDYDTAGNRIRVSGSFAGASAPEPVDSLVYDEANRLTLHGGATLTYDENGNLTSDGARTYTWNPRNQLASIDGSGTTASFGYDAFGRRIQRTVNGNSTEFLLDGLNVVVEKSGGAAIATLLSGLGIDEPFIRADADGSRVLLFDALGSTLGLLDEGGNLQAEYTYEPFGAVAITGSPSTNRFQYTGRENDGTGLYYYRARYYSPTLRRFISEDPIGLVGKDVNLYAYAFNSPTNFRDPLGLFPDILSECLDRFSWDEPKDTSKPKDDVENLREGAEGLSRQQMRITFCISLAAAASGGGPLTPEVWRARKWWERGITTIKSLVKRPKATRPPYDPYHADHYKDWWKWMKRDLKGLFRRKP